MLGHVPEINSRNAG